MDPREVHWLKPGTRGVNVQPGHWPGYEPGQWAVSWLPGHTCLGATRAASVAIDQAAAARPHQRRCDLGSEGCTTLVRPRLRPVPKEGKRLPGRTKEGATRAAPAAPRATRAVWLHQSGATRAASKGNNCLIAPKRCNQGSNSVAP